MCQGCKGIPGYKYTLSTLGSPCYWDHMNKDCAWCIKKTQKQCGETAYSTKCGNMCGQGWNKCLLNILIIIFIQFISPAKNKKCDGNLYTCDMIPSCGPGASCNSKTGRCTCDQGIVGKIFSN